jgi:hypothetical protein
MKNGKLQSTKLFYNSNPGYSKGGLEPFGNGSAYGFDCLEKGIGYVALLLIP